MPCAGPVLAAIVVAGSSGTIGFGTVALSLSFAVGAALQVVVEVGRYVARRAPGGLRSGPVIGGYLAGIVVMYVTGLLIA